MANEYLTVRSAAGIICVLTFIIWTISCSMPNLEPAECEGARTALKQFYSFHFAGDMTATQESLKNRERFLTPGFSAKLSGPLSRPGHDVFTDSSEPATTFKIGKCTSSGPGKTAFDVSVYWRTDERTIQKELRADMISSDGRWLLDDVHN